MNPGAPFWYFSFPSRLAAVQVLVTVRKSIIHGPNHLRYHGLAATSDSSDADSFDLVVAGCCCGGLRSTVKKYKFVAKLMATICPRSMNAQV